MDKSVKENLVHDIENRLNDFFGEADPQPQASTQDVPNTLEKLKSMVLSIDWEITDACLSDLITETNSLLIRYQNDRSANALLRMLKTLGNYIRKHKAQAHQEAIRLFMSGFASLEKIIGGQALPESQKKHIAAMEIQAFKNLKDQIELRRVTQGQVEKAASISEKGHTVALAEFNQVINALEERVNDQLALLKSQMTILQKELSVLRKKIDPFSNR